MTCTIPRGAAPSESTQPFLAGAAAEDRPSSRSGAVSLLAMMRKIPETRARSVRGAFRCNQCKYDEIIAYLVFADAGLVRGEKRAVAARMYRARSPYVLGLATSRARVLYGEFLAI